MMLFVMMLSSLAFGVLLRGAVKLALVSLSDSPTSCRRFLQHRLHGACCSVACSCPDTCSLMIPELLFRCFLTCRFSDTKAA